MNTYTQHVHGTRQTPSGVQADPRQVPNNARGFGFPMTSWERLEQFLILGTAGGTYYVSERKLTQDNAQAVRECLDEDGPRAVQVIRDVSVSGRAAKNDQAVFALAMAAGHADAPTRAAALGAVADVCRVGTHLFQFVEAAPMFRGWGRSLRRALANWYRGREADQLAYQLAKYQGRGGQSHSRVLRRAGGALKQLTPAQHASIRWALGRDLGELEVDRSKGGGNVKRYASVADALPRLLDAVNRINKAATDKDAAQIVREHRLTHEMVPTRFKKSAEVWFALLESMPTTAVIRELGRMTALGVVAPFNAGTKLVTEALSPERIRKGRVHPMRSLIAMRVYAEGRSKGLTWQPVNEAASALEAAFYAGFDTVTPNGKRNLLAIDVSDSMTWPHHRIKGILTCREAAAAMAMVAARTEPNHQFVAFSHGMVEFYVSSTDSLPAVCNKMASILIGGTDCALPMLWALQNKIGVDGFQLFTDCEHWAGRVHPHQALRMYRERTQIPAKLVITGMVSTGLRLADPNDAGTLEVAGFDAGAPAVIADFIRGEA